MGCFNAIDGITGLTILPGTEVVKIPIIKIETFAEWQQYYNDNYVKYKFYEKPQKNNHEEFSLYYEPLQKYNYFGLPQFGIIDDYTRFTKNENLRANELLTDFYGASLEDIAKRNVKYNLFMLDRTSYLILNIKTWNHILNNFPIECNFDKYLKYSEYRDAYINSSRYILQRKYPNDAKNSFENKYGLELSLLEGKLGYRVDEGYQRYFVNMYRQFSLNKEDLELTKGYASLYYFFAYTQTHLRPSVSGSQSNNSDILLELFKNYMPEI